MVYLHCVSITSPYISTGLIKASTKHQNMADEQAFCTVINEQFREEVAYKEDELQRIDDRIQLAKMMLHRLRLGILAQQYGLSGFYLMEDYSQENVGVQASWNNFESDFLSSRVKKQQQQEEEEIGAERKTEGGEDAESVYRKREDSTPEQCEDLANATCMSSVHSSQLPTDNDVNLTTAGASQPLLDESREMSSLVNDVRKSSPSNNHTANVLPTNIHSNGQDFSHTSDTQCLDRPVEPPSPPPLPTSLSRFATKKRIIVGNTSQFLDPSARSTIDGSTHKWMVYVRGPSQDADITSFVRAVRFFLHPSYHPNDIIRIAKPPFHLTRYGWGEFPVRVQLEFTDKCNKHVDIIHNLVLDRTHTGHQTLGSETVVDLDLMTTQSEINGGSSTVILKNTTIHPFSSTINDLNKGGNIVKSETESSKGIPVQRESSQHIHHIFIPAISSVDQVLLDHSYAQVVVVSRRPKCLQTVQTTVDDDVMDTCDGGGINGDDAGETTLDDVLHSIVKTVPLCGPESNGFNLVSLSIEHFTNWNIGRRRAAEWMRALAMKRVIQALEPPIHAATSLTTKQVVEWCRKNGYTPLDPISSSSRGFCKYCGCQLPSGSEETSTTTSHLQCSNAMETIMEEREYYSSDSYDSDQEDEEGGVKTTTIQRQFSTLSDPFQLFESLTAKAKKVRVLHEQQAREQVVDVLSVPSKKQQVVEAVPRFRVPQTPELKWVQRTAAVIGIHIYPAVIDRMYAHVVEHMIYMACTKFARVIMDRAVTESAREVEANSNQERCIVPLHIYRAVESLDSCDFLTNSYLGLSSIEATDEPPSNGGDKTLRED